MNAKILNRDFQHPADGWYQIEAKGNHPNRAAGVVQVIDEEAINQIVNRFNTDAQAGSLRHGNEMLIDHEHFSDQADKESRAYGWLQELQNRADGIYGRIRWTATGKAAVDGGDYRFFSTEYSPADLKILNDGKTPRHVRPVRLDGLSLTNMNNNRGQKPITNRKDTLADADASAANQNHNERTNTMKSIAAKLGLAAEASEDAILAEVTKLQNRVTGFDAEMTPLKNRVTELETSNKSLLDEQVDGILAEHGIKEEKVINRLKPMLAPLKNRADRVACLADLGHKPVAAAKKDANVRILNRQDGKTGEAETEETDAAELANKAENEVQQYKITNRCSYEEARNTVRRMKPELFGLKK